MTLMPCVLNPLYITRPMDSLIHQQPDVMINIAASPFAYNHDEERIAILSDNASRTIPSG
jgi:NAD+ synthase (glutamine-hydrolysing)